MPAACSFTREKPLKSFALLNLLICQSCSAPCLRLWASSMLHILVRLAAEASNARCGSELEMGGKFLLEIGHTHGTTLRFARV